MHCLKKLENFLCKVIVFLIAVYRVMISPFFPRCCRFDPTCSVYAREAFLRHGFIKGLYLSCWRILRCNPWNPGGKDPVP